MEAWIASFDIPQKIFAAFAIPATIILIIQSVLLFFGFGDHGVDVHMEHSNVTDHADGDGVALFSVRGIVAFFAVGGWLGLVLLGAGVNLAVAIILSFSAGFLALYGIALLMKAAIRLQSSGNLELKNAVGLTGRVYIKIPASGKGRGKITITMQERFSELEAVTLAKRDLLTDELVKVTGVQGEEALVVQPFAEDVEPDSRRKPKISAN